MKTLLLITISMIISFPLTAGGRQDLSEKELTQGIDSFNNGNIQEAIELFSKSTNSGNRTTAAAAFYNHGTALALEADKTEDAETKLSLLNSAYQSLKRAHQLDSLLEEDKVKAQRNMQIIREKIAKITDQQKQEEDNREKDSGEEENENESDSSGNEQQKDQQKDQQSNSNPGQKGESQNQKTSPNSDQDNGEQQTGSNTDSGSEKQDVNSTENEKTAGEAEDSEVENILDEESKNRQIRAMLESKGGISDVEKDW